jgi:peptidase M42 family hydrolase
MVKNLKSNGRLEIVPIGSWSSRFAEGARVTIFTDTGSKRGTILPLKASGHTYNEAIDNQPVSWDNVEIRTDDFCASAEALEADGYSIGDFIALDPRPEVYNGFINSRYLDNNAGVACMLAAMKTLKAHARPLPFDCYMLFTISEEVGTGASTALHDDIAELIAVDNSTPAPGQNSQERSVTIAMADSSGPFDYHLTHKPIDLCKHHGIEHRRDVFKYYRCDTASAVEAGNDLRFALVGFGTDASHGYERTHLDGLAGLTRLLVAYAESGLTFKRDQHPIGPLAGFPLQPE